MITCTNPTVTLNGTGNLGNPFTYQWTTPNGNIASGANTLQPIVDAPGDYSLLITNTNNGCTAISQVAVAKDANVPTATADVTGELNCVVSQLTLSGANSTQGATITTTWSTTNGNIVSGGNGLSPVVDKPGQYTLTIFNTANNCVASSTVNVNLNLAPPMADAGPPAIISCQNPVLTLNGNGSSQGPQYSYDWSTATGNIITLNTILTPKVDQSGFYTIQVTDSSNGCTATSTVQIVLDQNTPESNPGASPTLTCAVTSLSLNGTASSVGSQFSYVWTTTNGQIVSGANTLTPTVDKPGTYKLLVSNALNGCSALDSVTVNQNITPPNADAGVIPTLTCAVTSLSLDGTASSNGNNQFAYLWTTTAGQIISGNTTMTPSIGDPGYYLLKVTDLINGCIDTAGVQVKEDVVPPLAASAVAGELTCAVTTLPLNGTGSSTGAIYQYQWTTTSGQIIDGPTTLSPNVGKPGTYQLLVTNTQNGCTTTSDVAVTQNITPPQVDAGATNQLTCTVLQLNLAGTGSGGVNGVSYSWSGPGIVSGGNTAAPLINALGTYKLLVTDLYNGCTARDSVKIIPNTALPVITIANPALLTCQTGEVPISGEGSSTGTQFSYAWSGPGILTGNNTLNIMANVAGVYELTITNTLNGCTSEQSANLQQDVSLPIAEAGTGFELTCTVESGALSASGSSYGSNFIYQWSTTNGYILSGSSSSAPVVNEVGVYNLLVTNTLTGCKSNDNVVVTRNTNYPTDIKFLGDPPACGNQLGSINFEAITGGVGPYLYSIDGGVSFQTAELFEDLNPGSYNLIVQDANGCEYDEPLDFPVPVEPTVSLPADVAIQFGESATLTATLNIPLSQIDTIIWSPMESITLTNKPNVVTVRPFTNTEYTVTIINKDGCEDRDKIIVAVGDPNIWAPNVISPDPQDGQNDVFLLFARERTVKKINSLQIYDRWGTQVFQVKDILPNSEKQGWDGSFRGVPMNPAVFVWWAEVELEDGRKILMKGDVTIVR